MSSLSSAEEHSSATPRSCSTITEQLESLKDKFRSILEEQFFANFQHNWQGIEEVHTSLSSFEFPTDKGDGSFIVLEGKKIPMTFFAKDEAIPVADKPAASLVQESKSSLSPKDDNPYAIPTPQEVAEELATKHRFHTARSRAREGLRQRLHVAEKSVEDDKLGVQKKFRPRLATQLDAHYQNELSYRPRIHQFSRVDGIHKLRDTARRQFVTYYRKEYLYRQTEKRRIEQGDRQTVLERCLELRQTMKDIRQQRFSAAMRMLDRVKPCYEETARLEVELKARQCTMTSLWNRVIQLESIWVQRLKLQNFLHLIMPKTWRLENDWIHMDDDGELEGYEMSIAKRSVVNLRDIDKGNDIWAVKRFFEEEYLAKNKPVHLLFEDTASLRNAIEELNVNSMTLLSQLNLANWDKSNAELTFTAQKRRYAEKIESLRLLIQDTGERKTFFEQRTVELKQRLQALVNGPVRDWALNERNREIESLVYVTYRNLLPPEQRANVMQLSGLICCLLIYHIVTDLLAAIDRIPADVYKVTERIVRFRRMRRIREAKQAVEEDHRLRQMTAQFERSLAPPYVTSTRKPARPRSRLRKVVVPVVVKAPKINLFEQIFKLAFGGEEALSENELRHYQNFMLHQNLSGIQFDQFLRSLGYEPDYEMKSRVETTEGPVEGMFRKTELIPVVMRKLQGWQKVQQLLRQKLLKISKQ